MAEEWAYPPHVTEGGRIYLKITAWEYSLPTLPERDATGDIYNGVTIRKNSNGKLFDFYTYVPGGFGDTVSAKWESSDSIGFTGSARNLSIGYNAETGEYSSGFGDVLKGALHAKLQKSLSSIKLGGFRQQAEAATGTRIAPNEAKVFMGNSGRQLSIPVKFTPKNAEEGETMMSVIKAFRNSTTSELDSLAGGMVTLFKYPPIFDICVVKGGNSSARTGDFIKFNQMCLTSFDVKYSEGEELYAWFSDGTPTNATLSLSFESMFPAFRRAGTNIDDENPAIEGGGGLGTGG